MGNPLGKNISYDESIHIYSTVIQRMLSSHPVELSIFEFICHLSKWTFKQKSPLLYCFPYPSSDNSGMKGINLGGVLGRFGVVLGCGVVILSISMERLSPPLTCSKRNGLHLQGHSCVNKCNDSSLPMTSLCYPPLSSATLIRHSLVHTNASRLFTCPLFHF